MPYYNTRDKIAYYKNLWEQQKKENIELMAQIESLIKQITSLECQINVLKNKYERKEND